MTTGASVTAGTLNGGSGIVATKGNPANHTILHAKQQCGATIASSYGQENAAERRALDRVLPLAEAAAKCRQPIASPGQRRMLNKLATKTTGL